MDFRETVPRRKDDFLLRGEITKSNIIRTDQNVPWTDGGHPSHDAELTWTHCAQKYIKRHSKKYVFFPFRIRKYKYAFSKIREFFSIFFKETVLEKTSSYGPAGKRNSFRSHLRRPRRYDCLLFWTRFVSCVYATKHNIEKYTLLYTIILYEKK